MHFVHEPNLLHTKALRAFGASPEDVAVTPGVVAAGVLVELVAARVVLDDVAGGSLLDVHALVAVCRDGVPAHGVVVRLVLAVGPLVIREGGAGQRGRLFRRAGLEFYRAGRSLCPAVRFGGCASRSTFSHQRTDRK